MFCNMRSTKYNKETLMPVVQSSISMAEVIRKLGIKWSGGQQQYIKSVIVRLGIDTSHFLGQGSGLGKKNVKAKTWQEILVRNRSWIRETPFRLRRALIDSGRKYECEACGNSGQWMGNEIVLQVDHKNGDVMDNRKENVRFLCPNCHSQTEGWSGKKGRTGITKPIYKKNKPKLRKARKVHQCIDCQKKVQRRSTRCSSCYAIQNRKANRPKRELLLREVDMIGYSAVGRKYGVSDNAVRKWVKAV